MSRPRGTIPIVPPPKVVLQPKLSRPPLTKYYQPAHVIMGDYHTPAGGTIGNYTALWLHFSALGVHYPSRGLPEVEAARGRDNVARGQYNFQLAREQGCYNDIIV